MKPSKIFAFSAVAFATVLAQATLTVAGAPASGIAYDEVTKLMTGSASADPGSFSTDFSAAVDAQKAAAAPGTHRGLFGNLMNAVDTARNALNVLKNGTASSEYFLAGMHRSDDPGAQTATVSKPQQHQIIYLNLEKKTYRIADTNVQAPSATPPPVDRARTAQQPARPGTGKLDIRVSSVWLGSRVIENVQTTGYKVTYSLTETQSTGSCSDGTFTTSMVEYFSSYPEPGTSAGAVRKTPAPAATRPELMALKPGCQPAVSMHTSGGAQPPSGRLSMWTLVTVNGGAPSAQGQMSGGFSTLVERGNVRTLTAGDKGLFGIPAGYTQEQ